MGCTLREKLWIIHYPTPQSGLMSFSTHFVPGVNSGKVQDKNLSVV